MSKPSLIVLSASDVRPTQRKISKGGLSKRMQEKKAIFDRKWLVAPETFRNTSCYDLERLKRTKQCVDKWMSSSGSLVDIGCGFGDLSIYCKHQNHKVTATEITPNAKKHLKNLSELGINLRIEQLPFTHLEDKSFDYVLCTDTIGELAPREYRLTFSELARLLKYQGTLICSSPFDHKASYPHRTFIALAETEFQTLDFLFSYHYIYEKIMAALKKASQTPPRLAKLLSPFSFIASKTYTLLSSSSSIMLTLEKITKFLLREKGITHIIYAGKKKSLFQEKT